MRHGENNIERDNHHVIIPEAYIIEELYNQIPDDEAELRYQEITLMDEIPPTTIETPAVIVIEL